MARVTKRLAFLLTAGVVGASLVATPATAAPTWRPVTNLFADLSAAGGSAFTPSIGVDVAGNATVRRWTVAVSAENKVGRSARERLRLRVVR